MTMVKVCIRRQHVCIEAVEAMVKAKPPLEGNMLVFKLYQVLLHWPYANTM